MGDTGQRKNRTTRRSNGDTTERLMPVKASDVNDDPAQILDVVTLSEQEKEHNGVIIQLDRYVYDPAELSLGESVLNEILASETGSTNGKKKGEIDS